MPDPEGRGPVDSPSRVNWLRRLRALAWPSLGIFRPIRVQANRMQAPNICGSFCSDKDGPYFPCATQWNQKTPIKLYYDTTQYLGRTAVLEYWHGLHSYATMETTTKVKANGTDLEEIRTSGCTLEKHQAPGFMITSPETIIEFDVVASRNAPAPPDWGWFLLGRGSNEAGAIPDVTLSISVVPSFGQSVRRVLASRPKLLST